MASFLRVFYGFRVDTGYLPFSSLSESGFIPTDSAKAVIGPVAESSHLFQRVASFLLQVSPGGGFIFIQVFSSLSESGFIPTNQS